jgi:hypothetical protein
VIPGTLVTTLEPVRLYQDIGTDDDPFFSDLESYAIFPGELVIVLNFTRFVDPSDKEVPREETALCEFLTDKGIRAFNVFMFDYIDHVFEIVSE